MSDFLDQIIKATSPLFNFFYEWCWLILPLAYFESCFFHSKHLQKYNAEKRL